MRVYYASSKDAGGNVGKDRTKGTPNKISAALKDMILGALDDAGGRAYLKDQALNNPTAFMTLIGKVLPTTITGDPNAPLMHELRVDAPIKETREEWLARQRARLSDGFRDGYVIEHDRIPVETLDKISK